MTKLERLLNYKKFSFEKDWEGQISVKFFKHTFLLIENTYIWNVENIEWWITILWSKTSNISKYETQKAFIKFIQLLKAYEIEYVFDKLLDFND